MQLVVTDRLCTVYKMCGHCCAISFWIFEVAIFQGYSAPKLCTHFSLPTSGGQPGKIASWKNIYYIIATGILDVAHFYVRKQQHFGDRICLFLQVERENGEYTLKDLLGQEFVCSHAPAIGPIRIGSDLSPLQMKRVKDDTSGTSRVSSQRPRTVCKFHSRLSPYSALVFH